MLKCDFCHKPIGNNKHYVKLKKDIYHKNCYKEHIALKCALCKLPIQGKFLKDYWGNSYHIGHLNKVPKCNYCGRFINKELTDGTYKVEWNASALPSGTYFYTIKAGSFTATKKMILMK